MLEWEKTAPNTVVAYLNGYSYTITEDEDEEVWGVEITTPDGGSDSAISDTLEEAEEYCESTAKNVGSA
jgi:hypothetical protein